MLFISRILDLQIKHVGAANSCLCSETRTVLLLWPCMDDCILSAQSHANHTAASHRLWSQPKDQSRELFQAKLYKRKYSTRNCNIQQYLPDRKCMHEKYASCRESKDRGVLGVCCSHGKRMDTVYIIHVRRRIRGVSSTSRFYHCEVKSSRLLFFFSRHTRGE